MIPVSCVGHCLEVHAWDLFSSKTLGSPCHSYLSYKHLYHPPSTLPTSTGRGQWEDKKGSKRRKDRVEGSENILDTNSEGVSND